MYVRVTKHIFLHVGLCLIIVLSFFSPAHIVFWQTFVCALLHECCHLALALLLHVPILRLDLMPYGCCLKLGRIPYAQECAIAAAGPFGSLCFCLFCLWRGQDIWAMRHASLLFINLLPALPLDGGRLLRFILWKNIGFMRGNTVIRHISRLTAAALFAAGFFLRSVFCFLIAYTVFLHSLSPQTFSTPLLLKKEAGGERIKLFSVSEKDTLLSLLPYYSPFYRALFYVRDTHTFLPETKVWDCLRSRGSLCTVHDVSAKGC